MTTIERMALAMWRADALRELGPPVYDDIPDNLRETYLGYAKTALAALLLLDEYGVETATDTANDAFDEWNPEDSFFLCPRTIGAIITAYLKHIEGDE